METTHSRISAISSYVPTSIVTNDVYEKRFSMPNGIIFAKTGLMARRYSAPNEHPTDMGIKVARMTLDEAGVRPQDVDMIISASASKDQPIPTDAMTYASKLGIPEVQTCHMEVVCLSFVQALEVADLYIRSGKHQAILIITAEKCSKTLDPNSPEATIVLGDGAAAALITPSTGDSRIVASRLITAASERNLKCAYIKGGGTRYHPFDPDYVPEWAYFYVDGGLQLKLALRYFPPLIKELLRQANCTTEDIDYVVPHQVIPRMIQSIVTSMGFSLDKVYINGEYGNQAAASIPIGLADMVKSGKIRRGDRILLIGGAAGFSVGGAILIF